MTYNIKNDLLLLAGLLCTCFMTCQLRPNSESAPIAADTVYVIPDAYSGFDSMLSCAIDQSDSANQVVISAIQDAKRSRNPVMFSTPKRDTVIVSGHPIGHYK